MMSEDISTFLMGAIFLGWIVAALFFVRFWRETRDRLFLIFSISFIMLALTRIVMAIWNPEGDEHHTHLYWLRLAAYVLIIIAIVDKNLHAKRSV
jgi:hypothetical protein